MTGDQCPSCGRPAQSSIVLSSGMRVIGCPCVDPGQARFVEPAWYVDPRIGLDASDDLRIDAAGNLTALAAKVLALGGRPDCVHVNPERVNAARKIWFRMAWFRMCVT